MFFNILSFADCKPILNLFIPYSLYLFNFSSFTVPGFISIVISASSNILKLLLISCNIFLYILDLKSMAFHLPNILLLLYIFPYVLYFYFIYYCFNIFFLHFIFICKRAKITVKAFLLAKWNVYIYS